VLAAIDVGTNAIRLELAKVDSDGSLETLHTERDPVRPGEGVFASGILQKPVADRVVATLRRYAALCRRYHAKVRAVATSAFREAKNREEVVERVKLEAGLHLDVISGREEARLICLGVLHGKPPSQRTLCIDIGGGSTEVIVAQGDRATDLWSFDLGAVRLTELFQLQGVVPPKQLQLVRNFARELMSDRFAKRPALPTAAIGSSGTIGAVVAFARADGIGHATQADVTLAVEVLAKMEPERRRKRFDPKRAEIVVAGAVILEAVLRHLKVQSIASVDRGLREGLLFELLRRRRSEDDDRTSADAAIDLGRRFAFSEPHGRQVARLSLSLFDQLATVHQLPAAARPLLEVAALLHDIGHSINHQKHHKHTHYLISNADLAGVTDRERLLVATIARFHRRTVPNPRHELMVALTPSERKVVRKCATLLRVADSLDRSHHQPVGKLVCRVQARHVTLIAKATGTLDLELWDVAHEADSFRAVFGRTLEVQPARVRAKT
jgi:exopolyphosphatase / guanosine-5'-triphosphate,3'-diphosphate pyrophosphatase